MAKVVVNPQEFHFVSYDAGRVAEIVGKVADEIGLPADTEVKVEIDEKTPLTRSRTESLDPITLFVEGGAIEDPTEPRKLSDRLTVDVLGRLLLRAKDRLDGGFADAPADADLDLLQQTAWDTYAMGRLERLGYDVRQPRRLYHFRNRHGFTDVADRVFQRLWTADSLTWADITAACAETAAVKPQAASA
jgi:hypothetical protein